MGMGESEMQWGMVKRMRWSRNEDGGHKSERLVNQNEGIRGRRMSAKLLTVLIVQKPIWLSMGCVRSSLFGLSRAQTSRIYLPYERDHAWLANPHISLLYLD